MWKVDEDVLAGTTHRKIGIYAEDDGVKENRKQIIAIHNPHEWELIRVKGIPPCDYLELTGDQTFKPIFFDDLFAMASVA